MEDNAPFTSSYFQPATYPNQPKHNVSIRNVRRLVAAWDFQKSPSAQNPATMDLGEELLMPPCMKGRAWKNEEERCEKVFARLQFVLRKILWKLGCHAFCHTRREDRNVMIGYPRKGAPKPKLPSWLRIPYIVIEEGDDFDDIPEEREVIPN